MSEAWLKAQPSLEALVGEVADEFLRRQQQGERPDIEEYAARYPQAAEVLRKVLASLRILDLSGRGSGGSAAGGDELLAGTLGDFRLMREVGRGGMGIVYEAEQISLGRRVALKVLPLAATLDPRHLQRFQNEARAAACLHHAHIVPVHAVGCERGVHYYAMQFIDGLTLAQLLAPQVARPPALPDHPTTVDEPPGPANPGAATTVAAAETMAQLPRDSAHFRRIAEWGIQAAVALEYAHQMGIVHRDIKPGNLMIDGQGKLWITDFGLARTAAQGSMTQTGDLVGTLRYMSPEQALARHGLVDHRCDVYALGATLYELLTLRPAVEGSDRQEIVKTIVEQEPRWPRSLNRAVPGELETIVLKTLAKEPADRYATAKELADDLRRYLDDQPIQARRPSLVQRGRKWARRHRVAVRAVAAVVLVLAAVAAANGLWWVQKRATAEGEARAALQEATEWQRQEKWPEALSAVRRARAAIGGIWADPSLAEEIREREKDVEMAGRLQEARMQLAPLERPFDWQPVHDTFVQAFQWYGLDVDHLDCQEAGEWIGKRSIRGQVVAALEDWATARWRLGLKGIKQLVAVCRVCDPDPWRDRLRDALGNKDVQMTPTPTTTWVVPCTPGGSSMRPSPPTGRPFA
jgi:serine/threonine protein kinase